MNETKSGRDVRQEVVQRYCPKHGENVVMLRSVGETRQFECLNYERCDLPKDSFCGRAGD